MRLGSGFYVAVIGEKKDLTQRRIDGFPIAQC